MTTLAIDYAAVAFAAMFAFITLAGGLLTVRFVAPRKPSEEKSCPYECGMAPIGQFWSQMHLRYYLFAILFLIFDVETVFLYPWAVIFLKSAAVVFYEMLLFIAILLFGLLYAWKKGVLQWK